MRRRSAVERIGIKSTRLRSNSGELIVISNSDLLKSRVRNYTRLTERRAELAAWASTVVRLPEANNLDRLRHEIENFATEFLLFVGAVREVRDDALAQLHADHVRDGRPQRGVG